MDSIRQFRIRPPGYAPLSLNVVNLSRHPR